MVIHTNRPLLTIEDARNKETHVFLLEHVRHVRIRRRAGKVREVAVSMAGNSGPLLLKGVVAEQFADWLQPSAQ